MVMSRSISRGLLRILVFLFVSPGIALAGQIIYVDADSPGGDGSSWGAAFDCLPDALAFADANDEIRVAQGTYIPDRSIANPAGNGDRKATFQLISGVGIYGGYAGYGEVEPDARDVRQFETILSGDLLGNDLPDTTVEKYATDPSRADNTYNILTATDTDEKAVLDGFTITAAQADGFGVNNGTGGGMYNGRGNPTIVDCTFTRNWARSMGGAARNESGSRPVFIRCRFMGNAAESSGGAVSNYYMGSAEFINCCFTGNISFSGQGGAIHTYNTVTLTNCTLSGNSATDAGGIIIAREPSTCTNCIFWGNSDSGGMDESAQIHDSKDTAVVNFCCVQGWTGSLGGAGNFGDAPLLADADGADNLFGTIDDNPRLLPGSPCSNAGDNAAVPTALTGDLDGNPRIIDGTVDTGAYEGASQAILLTTESLTIEEGGTGSFGIFLATAPQETIEVSARFASGDADISVISGSALVFDSNNYQAPQTVTVSAAEDADYLHGKALILIEGDNLISTGVTVTERDNEPTTGIVYVDDDATGSGNGMTWANAYDNLQEALYTALWNPQVWEIRVAQGIYRPDVGMGIVPGDRKATFVLNSGIAVKGGYAGFGAVEPNVKDVTIYETILSGDLDGDDDGFDNNDENSYHVVYTEDANETAVLDGFKITGANANRVVEWGSGRGAGIRNFGGRPTIIDCTVTGNSAADRGGGMYNHEGGPTLIRCTFSNNSTDTDGGGMYNHHQGPIMSNCLIADNFAARNGGGIGGDNLYTGDLIMTNCTIAGNEAGEYGGGMYEYDGSELYLTNSILWGNVAYEGPQMALKSRAIAFIRYCCFQGGQLDIYGDAGWGHGNTDADPLFADSSSQDYHLKSRAGRYDPNDRRWKTDEATSPCIDAGDPQSEWTSELWPHGKRVNMGAFGQTAEASMAQSLLGNRADLNKDGFVSFSDFAALSNSLCEEGPLQGEDLNRDAIVDFFDIRDFAEEWLWQELQ